MQDPLTAAAPLLGSGVIEVVSATALLACVGLFLKAFGLFSVRIEKMQEESHKAAAAARAQFIEQLTAISERSFDGLEKMGTRIEALGTTVHEAITDAIRNRGDS